MFFLGEIIYKTILRLLFVLFAIWFTKDFFDEIFFWIISLLGIYFFVINYSILSYQKFTEINNDIINNTLCSSCKHFDGSAVLCMKYDKHPTKELIPCKGNDWELR